MLEGYKTKVGLIVSVLLGILQAFGVGVESHLVDSVQALAAGLVGYGIYDKIGRK